MSEGRGHRAKGREKEVEGVKVAGIVESVQAVEIVEGVEAKDGILEYWNNGMMKKQKDRPSALRVTSGRKIVEIVQVVEVVEIVPPLHPPQ